MIGITKVASYICENRISNKGRIFDGEMVDDEFLLNRLGVRQLAQKEEGMKASDLCLMAFDNLLKKFPELEKDKIDCLCVCTQNKDYVIPHTSAIVHGKLGLSEDCAVFDISLGCSGYVYSLGIMKSYMEQNCLKYGLLFTSDPMTDIIDINDRGTSMVFGDGATVTLLTRDYKYSIGPTSYYTDGSNAEVLQKTKDGFLEMDGRIVLSFALGNISNVINKNLKKENLVLGDIDLFIFHQASKYIMERVIKRLSIEPAKAPYDILDYGNTSSSTIPIILEKNLYNQYKRILLCGFGVGLSIASLIITKKEK